jgi:hypothetical protein
MDPTINSNLNVSNDEVIILGEYIVEKIICKKKIKGKWKYQIKWDGYPYEECTWEPIENLEGVKELVCEFEKKYENKNDTFDIIDNMGKIESSIRDNETIRIPIPIPISEANEKETEFDVDHAEPLKILKCKIVNGADVEFICHVEWKLTIGSIISCWISSKLLETKFPKFWIQFLYSRIKFPVM